jgi:MurNAc alpha-1-phosphate uridylyltransferase
VSASRAPLPVAILAGGLATRLRPLTEAIPKALLELNGEPFIAHQLRLLGSRGIERAIVCAGYLGERIRDEIGAGDKYGVHVEYSFDGPTLLGTAGALRQALPRLGQAFFVLYGDSYLVCDYAAVQQAFWQTGRTGLMTVYRNDNLHDRSNVEFESGSIVAYDKRSPTPGMCHIDYGLGVLAARALDEVPASQPYDLAALYKRLLERGELSGFEVPERFYEIGSFEGLEELRRVLATPTRSGVGA